MAWWLRRVCLETVLLKSTFPYAAGARTPWYLGIVYYDFDTDTRLYAVWPLNLIFYAWYVVRYKWWGRIRHFRTFDRELRKAWDRGYKAGLNNRGA